MDAMKDKFRAYVNLSPDDDSPIIELCLSAAMQHAADVGISADLLENEPMDPKLELYLLALAGHWYDNRNFKTDSWVRSESVKMRRELMYKQEG